MDELGQQFISVCMQSEVVADADKRQSFVSEFTGSAGKISAPLAMPVKLLSVDQENLRFHINYIWN